MTYLETLTCVDHVGQSCHGCGDPVAFDNTIVLAQDADTSIVVFHEDCWVEDQEARRV